MVKRKVFAIGETVYDVFFRNQVPFDAKPGGAILNTSVSLARLNIFVAFISTVSNDEIGSSIINFLAENHVDISLIKRNQSLTRLALAFLDQNNNARYVFYRVPPAEPESLFTTTTSKNDIVLFGSFYGFDSCVRPDLEKTIGSAISNESIIIYDPNFRKNHIRLVEKVMPFIQANFKSAHIIKTSDEDIQNMFGDNFDFREELFSCYPDKLWIITRGCKPVIVFYNGSEYQYDVPAVETVSTVGAGDNFNAGLIFSLIKQEIGIGNIKALPSEKLSELIKTAITFASHVCCHTDNYISNQFALKHRL